MTRKTTASQRAVQNIRKRLRKDMEVLALTHKGCDRARGCGCLVDRSLQSLEQAERELFSFELLTYADPTTQRRIVQADNSIGEQEEDVEP